MTHSDVPLSRKRLKEITGRLKVITPYPWEVIPDIRSDVVQTEIWSVSRQGGFENEGEIIRRVHYRYGHIAEFAKNYGDGRGMGSALDDAEFIAHAPEDIRLLLDEVNRLNKLIKAL